MRLMDWVSCAALAASSVAIAMTADARDRDDVVRCSRVEIVDAEGSVRAVLGPFSVEAGGPGVEERMVGLALFDGLGRRSGSLATSVGRPGYLGVPSHTGLVIEESGNRLGLSVHSALGVSIVAAEKERIGRPETYFGVFRGRIVLAHGDYHADLAAFDDGGGSLSFQTSEGCGVSLHGSGPGAYLYLQKQDGSNAAYPE